MRSFLRAAAAAGLVASSLAIAACTPQQVDDSLTAACGSISIADAGFQVYANTGKVSGSAIANERKAVASAQAICNGLAPTDVNASVGAVQSALRAIVKATNQAKAQAKG